MDAKVSIIIPAYNAESTIVRCLDSVKKQTYSNIEVIIIDDGSKDRTKSIIEEYIRDDDLNWIFISRENRGVSFTRNQGIKLASGEYIAFLDSDDYWMAEKLEKQVAFCLKHDCRVVGCLSNISKKKEKAYDVFGLDEMLLSNRLTTSSVLLKADLVKLLGGFDESMSYSEDYALWLRIACQYDIYVLNDTLVYYNLDYSEGLSSKMLEMEKGELANFYLLYKKKEIPVYKLAKYVFISVLKFIRRLVKKLLTKRGK